MSTIQLPPTGEGNVQVEKLLSEIIKGDFGGISCLSSNVFYIMNDDRVMVVIQWKL